jgi:hypothetical protein
MDCAPESTIQKCSDLGEYTELPGRYGDRRVHASAESDSPRSPLAINASNYRGRVARDVFPDSQPRACLKREPRMATTVASATTKRASTATGIRTRVSAMRGRRPSPLDDSGAKNGCAQATKALAARQLRTGPPLANVLVRGRTNADERTRTSTGLPRHGPEPCASTNSATSA